MKERQFEKAKTNEKEEIVENLEENTKETEDVKEDEKDKEYEIINEIDEDIGMLIVCWVSIEAIDDPYVNPINNEILQDIYDNLPMNSIPENDDQIFEFEPNFVPKNTEDYIVKAEGDVEYLRDIHMYSKELIFPIKSKKLCYTNSI